MLDLRKPAGFFFLALGAILTVAGAGFTYTAPLLNVNLNLYFGVFSIVFGGIFLWLARKA